MQQTSAIIAFGDVHHGQTVHVLFLLDNHTFSHVSDLVINEAVLDQIERFFLVSLSFGT